MYGLLYLFLSLYKRSYFFQYMNIDKLQFRYKTMYTARILAILLTIAYPFSAQASDEVKHSGPGSDYDPDTATAIRESLRMDQERRDFERATAVSQEGASAAAPRSGGGAAPAVMENFFNTIQQQHFIRMGEDKIDRYFQRLGGGLKFVQQYRLNQIALPNAPVIHPYNISLLDPARDRIYNGTPTFLFSARANQVILDNSHDQNIINYFIAPIEKSGICAGRGLAECLGAGNISILIVVQNNPWANLQLLLRPHYWVFQDAPYENPTPLKLEGVVNVNIFSNSGIHLLNRPGALHPEPISVHNGDVKTHDGKMVISSPDNMGISNPNNILFDQTKNSYFWSVVESGPNKALTLHCILNDKSFEALSAISAQIRSLPNLLVELNKILTNPPANAVAAAPAVPILPAGFDPTAYVSLNPDLKAYMDGHPREIARAGSANQWAINHYLAYGKNEGRQFKNAVATPDLPAGFDAEIYVGLNPDLKTYIDKHPAEIAAAGGPIQWAKNHYLNYGRNEGRKFSL